MRLLSVKVKPNARISALQCAEDGTWSANLKAPPVDGKANEELIALVAAYFALRRNQVSIKRGAASRTKTVRIDD